MQSIVRRDWLQISSNAAIIIGLIVIVYELNQNHHHVRAQLVMDDYSHLLAEISTLMGENPATAIAKARQDPSRMTPEDRIVVNAYLESKYIRNGATMYFAEDLEVFTFWEEIARYEFQEEFRFPYPRQWWREHTQAHRDWHEPLDRLLDELLVEFENEEADGA
jgi:hypothetical protein